MVKIPRLNSQTSVKITDQPNIPMDFGTNVGKAISGLGSAISGLGGALDKTSKAAQGEADAETNHMAAIEAKRAINEMQQEVFRNELETDWEKEESNPDDWYQRRMARLNELSRDYQTRVKPANEAGYRRLETALETFRNNQILKYEEKRRELVIGGKMRPARGAIDRMVNAIDVTKDVEPQVAYILSEGDKIINGITGIGIENKRTLRKEAAMRIRSKLEEYSKSKPKIWERLNKSVTDWLGQAANNARAVEKERQKGPPGVPDAKERKVLRAGASGTVGAKGPSDTPVSDRLIDFAMHFEGFKPRAYWDYKQWTNGYGTRARSPNEVIDEAEARRRLRVELADAVSFVERTVPPDTPSGIKAALAELTMNAGEKWASDGLGRAIQLKDYAEARERYLQYNGVRHADGRKEVLAGLQRRRLAGAQWWSDGSDAGNYDLSGAPRNVDGFLMSRLVSKDRRSDVVNLAPVMKPRLAAFLKAAQDAGHDIKVLSGHRSVERQRVLWRQALAKYGSVAAARKHVAPPGKSNHQQGVAADLQYGDRPRGLGGRKTPAVQWAHANAARFGLTFRLGHEDWHIEPIGFGSAGSRLAGSGGGYMALSGATAGITAGYTGGGGVPASVSTTSMTATAETMRAGAPMVADAGAGFLPQNEISGRTQVDPDGDGVPSSEQTITIQDDDGAWYNVPTIVDGQPVEGSIEEAFANGKVEPVGGPYDTSGEAVAAAKTRSEELGKGSGAAPAPVPPAAAGPGGITGAPGPVERENDGGVGQLDPSVIANIKAAQKAMPPGIMSELLPMLIDDMPRYRSMYLDAVKKEQEMAEKAAFVSKVTSGEITLNPHDSDQKKIVDEFWAEARPPEFNGKTIAEAFVNGTPEERALAASRIKQYSQIYNYIPEPFADALKTMAGLRPSEDRPDATANRMLAYEIVARISEATEGKALELGSWERVDDESILFSQLLVNGYSKTDAIKYIDQQKEPEYRKKRNDKEFMERLKNLEETELTQQKILAQVKNQWLDPNMPQDRLTVMSVEYREVFKHYYTMWENSEAAHIKAVQHLRKTYGPTLIHRSSKQWQLWDEMNKGVTRGVLMRNPPEKVFRAVGGSHSYLHDDLKATVLAKVNEAIRASVMQSLVLNGRDVSKMSAQELEKIIKPQLLTDIDLSSAIASMHARDVNRAYEKMMAGSPYRQWLEQWKRGEARTGPPRFGGYPYYTVRVINPASASNPSAPPFITFNWTMEEHDIIKAEMEYQAALENARIGAMSEGSDPWKRSEQIRKENEAEIRRRARGGEHPPTPPAPPPQPGDPPPEPPIDGGERQRARTGRRSEGKMPFPKPGNEQRSKDRRKARRSGKGDRASERGKVTYPILGNPEYEPFRRPTGGGGE